LERLARALGLALCAAACALGCGSPRSGVPASELWSEHCASCHGADGRGVPARRGLEPRVDLRRSEMLAAGDRGLAFQRVAYGYATMPGFAHKLERGDIELLVEFAAELATR
jgi:mono/diheme cytochrome c family protein